MGEVFQDTASITQKVSWIVLGMGFYKELLPDIVFNLD